MMKRIVLVLFLMGFGVLNSRADTIGHYHVYLHKHMIADFSEGSVIRVKVRADSIVMGDSIFVKRYYGCGGSPGEGKYTLYIKDNLADKTVYTDTSLHSPEFAIPLWPLLMYRTLNPIVVFTGSYQRYQTNRYYPGIRFEILLE